MAPPDQSAIIQGDSWSLERRVAAVVAVGAALAFVVSPSAALAQCAMCKASLEGSTDGLAAVFNRAILVMLAGPYLVMGVFGVVLFRERLRDTARRLLARLGVRP